MSAIDRWFADLTRAAARRSSRRGFLAQVGVLLVGAAALPLLPVARAQEPRRAAAPGEPDPSLPAGDPETR
jgi:methylamine dehydrogenase light chain